MEKLNLIKFFGNPLDTWISLHHEEKNNDKIPKNEAMNGYHTSCQKNCSHKDLLARYL